jgi:hypothetical protein
MTRSWWLLLSVITLFLLIVGMVAFGFAAVSAQANDSAKIGLTLSPIRTEIDAEPGTSQDKVLSITNNHDYPISVNLSVEEFSVINQQYDYAFNIETELIKWVTFTPGTLELAVGETKQATFRVGVPISAEPGGRYISMFATTDAGVSDAGVLSRQRIASLIYINVLGDVTRSGNLVSLNAPWVVSGPTEWTAVLQNTGTTHYRSRYNVVVQDIFGNTQTASNSGDALILPGTVRLITDSVPVPDFPGIYKLTYTIGLGDTPARVETRYMVYLPTQAIVIGLFAAILVASLISEYRSRKKRA